MDTIHFELLRSIKVLSGITLNVLESLLSIMTIKEYKKGKTLFYEGDSGDCMYIILYGAVSISVRSSNGKLLEIAEITEGNFFGEMSIFDKAARSATCIPKSDTKVFMLKADDFYEFIKTNPDAGIVIMHRMLNIITQRLQHSGAFLSSMVKWGEKARKRAITDDFTGLYNRRFFDDALDSRFMDAKRNKKPLSMAMLDLDNFSIINNEYGSKIGDKIILEASAIFRKTLRKEDILIRYGGDEFTFLLPGTGEKESLNICTTVIKEIEKIDLLNNLPGSIKTVSTSIGIACFPDHAEKASVLLEKADKALYAAKKAGRNTVILWKNQGVN